MEDKSSNAINASEQTKYVYSGRVMLTSVLILFIVCLYIVCFHMCAGWFLRRCRNHDHQSSTIATRPTTTTAATQKGLSSSILKSLPIFIYASPPNTPPSECAVCLSEFQKKETVRRLPTCKHCFHLDCIDMWFHSHSNCPLCRAPAMPPVTHKQLPENSLLSVGPESDSGPSEPDPIPELCPGCQKPGCQMGCSSSTRFPMYLIASDRIKLPELFGIVVEVPRINDGNNGLQ